MLFAIVLVLLNWASACSDLQIERLKEKDERKDLND